jgi:hypothetical protein
VQPEFENKGQWWWLQQAEGIHRLLFESGGVFVDMGIKRLGREPNYSPSSSAEVKKTFVYTSTSPQVLKA